MRRERAIGSSAAPNETVGAFAGKSIHWIDFSSGSLQDMRARGLGDPALVVSDGAPGVIRAIEECFPRSARQRRLAHRMRNLAAKVPADLWPDFKARATAACQAPSRAIARDLAAGLVADFEAQLPTATRCFMDDPGSSPGQASRPASRI